MTMIIEGEASLPSAAEAKRPSKSASRRRFPPSLVAGLILVSTVALVGLVAAFWTPYPLTATGEGGRLAPPSIQFPLGTDRLGRDLLTQLMAGAASALKVASVTILIAGVLGLVLGLVASATTRWLDAGVSKFLDILIAFPTLLLAMLVVTIRGASLSSAIMAIAISGSAVIARVTRVNASRVLREDYVRASRTSGTGRLGIVGIHVIPNVFPTLLVQLMLLAGAAILAEASLSYLGLGAPPPTASWGRMLLEAQSTVTAQPIGAIAPGVAIAITVLGLNLLGDGIREYTDPTLRGDR